MYELLRNQVWFDIWRMYYLAHKFCTVTQFKHLFNLTTCSYHTESGKVVSYIKFDLRGFLPLCFWSLTLPLIHITETSHNTI